MNNNVAVLGSTLGDEGKGKIVHSFSSNFDWVIRFGGGNNCGHTIYTNGKKYVHHLIPSIDFSNSKAKGFLGSGMVIDLDGLLSELTELEKDFPGVSNRIYVDPGAFVVLLDHKTKDKTENGDLGTTNRGIGPCYADRIRRRGTRVRDLMDNKVQIISDLMKLGVNFKYVLELKNELSSSRLLFEGAQGLMLDINHGTYPYVSSSDCTVSGIMSSGFGFVVPSKVYGVVKAYQTRVGTGPFPTEIVGTEAEELRRAGNEFGATTGRPRRVGWLDLPALKYAKEKSGITDLIITKLDILNGWEKVPVCVSYDKAPVCGDDFFNAKTKIIQVKCWKDPKNLSQIKEFLSIVEFFSELKVSFISCGTQKSDIVSIPIARLL